MKNAEKIEWVVAFYIFVSLYTPLFWFIDCSMERHGLSTFQLEYMGLGEWIVGTFLTVMPLVCIAWLSKNYNF